MPRRRPRRNVLGPRSESISGRGYTHESHHPFSQGDTQHLQRYERGENVQLSRRQIQILEMASHGLTNQEISLALGIGAETVKSHWIWLGIKLGSDRHFEPNAKRTFLVAKAIRMGLIR